MNGLFALADASMARANVQVYANVEPATKENIATNVNHILDVKMASVLSHGSVSATKIGVEFFATKVSIICSIFTILFNQTCDVHLIFDLLNKFYKLDE